MSFGVKFNTGTGSDNVLITSDDTPPGVFHSVHTITITAGQTSATINLTDVTKTLYVASIWETKLASIASPSVSITYDTANKTAVANVTFIFTLFSGGETCNFLFLEA